MGVLFISKPATLDVSTSIVGLDEPQDSDISANSHTLVGVTGRTLLSLSHVASSTGLVVEFLQINHFTGLLY